MNIDRLRADLRQKLATIDAHRGGMDPYTELLHYRTIADVIGFYAAYWDLDLFEQFSTILTAQRTIPDALMMAAMELKYRDEPDAALHVARHAMELDGGRPFAAALYADLLRERGRFGEARTICRDLQEQWPAFGEPHAVATQCDIDEQFPLPIDYYRVLQQAHALLHPRRYVEIGVSSGKSLALLYPGTAAIGIDPSTAVPEQQFFHSPHVEPHLFPITSNDFFNQQKLEGVFDTASFDLAFIDGLHIFEQALMDFANLERHATPSSVIFIHDCLPISQIVAERERQTMVWTGDVWKVIPCLKAVRPDLEIVTIPARPSGLAMIRNLNPASRVLVNQFDTIVEHFISQTLPATLPERFELLNVTTARPDELLAELLATQGAYGTGGGRP